MQNWVRQNIRIFFFIAVSAMAIYFVLGTDIALAQISELTDVGAQTGLGNEDPRIVIARIVRIALSFVGVIGLVLVIYGGYLYMTARGDSAKVEKSQTILINAGIGTAIILSALIITQFILGQLMAATGFGEGSAFDSTGEIISSFSQALGNGNLESHYPPRNAVDIPRNTNIAISFRVPIFAGSVMDGYTGDPNAVLPVNTDAIKIYETRLGESATLSDVDVSISPNQQSLVLDPQTFLGNSLTNTSYTVEITDEVLLVDAGGPGGSAISSGYVWSFNVSTEVDTTPPRIISVVPFADSANPRNILIQINYSEAMNPVFASGYYPDPSATPDFTRIKAVDNSVSLPADSILAGEWGLVNQFSTSEFISSDACGENSCGETIYCLPGDADITVTATAATLGAEPPAAILLADGLVDMSGNSLDGDGDGVATGPITDSYTWDFSTTDQIVLVEPSIVSVTPTFEPGAPASDVDFDQPISVTFDQLMSLSTINSENMILRSPSQQLWYTLSSSIVEIEDPYSSSTDPINVTRSSFAHGIFTANLLYGAEVTSDVRSIYQNCYIPSKSIRCTGAGDNCCNDEAQTGQCSYPHYTLPAS